MPKEPSTLQSLFGGVYFIRKGGTFDEYVEMFKQCLIASKGVPDSELPKVVENIVTEFYVKAIARKIKTGKPNPRELEEYVDLIAKQIRAELGLRAGDKA